MGPIAEQPRPRHRGRSYHNWPPDTLSALMIISSNYPMTSSCRLLDVRGTGLAVPSLLVVVSTACRTRFQMLPDPLQSSTGL